MQLLQLALPSVCGEQPIALVNPVVVVVFFFGGGFHGTPLADNSTSCNPFPALGTSFGGERWLVGALSPSLFGDFI